MGRHRLGATLLFGVTPADPLTAVGGRLATLAIAALVAAWLPARRAARIDPLVALRHELITMSVDASPRPTVVVFDLGGVLVDWNPRYLYRTLFDGDEAAMERFLAEVCTPAWNDEQDRGRPWDEACALLVRDHPDRRALIEAWPSRFDETMAGPIPGTVEILAELRERDVPLYALSNWSAETFPKAQRAVPVPASGSAAS